MYTFLIWDWLYFIIKIWMDCLCLGFLCRERFLHLKVFTSSLQMLIYYWLILFKNKAKDSFHSTQLRKYIQSRKLQISKHEIQLGIFPVCDSSNVICYSWNLSCVWGMIDLNLTKIKEHWHFFDMICVSVLC